MEYLSAFREPGVIISVTITVVGLLFSSHFKKTGDWIIKHLGLLPGRLKADAKVKFWRYKRQYLERVYNPAELNWQIVRTYSLMLLFAMSLTLYVLLLAIGPLKGIGTLPTGIQLFICSPVLVLEALWLFQREYTRALIDTAGKRVTSQLTTRYSRRTR